MTGIHDHVVPERLLEYWLHETPADATDAIDEHLMQCDACGEALESLAALGNAVATALRAGRIAVAASGSFTRQLAASGLRLREYRLPPNGSVNCTVAPDDDLLVSILEAPLQDVERLDLVAEFSFEPGVRHRMEDVPFDPRQAEVLFLPRTSWVKQSPDHTLQVTLLAVDATGSREIGRYKFHHHAWPA